MKKRTVSLLVLLMIVGLAGAMPVAAADPADPVLIGTAEELTDFATAINNGTLPVTTNAKLTENIVFNENQNKDPDTNWEHWEDPLLHSDLKQWTPIGKVDNGYQYNGTFDGDGHTVSGIYINSSDGNPQGLFGMIYGQAEIKNLGVIESWINGTGDSGNIGGIVGQSYGSVSNCYNTGTVHHVKDVGGVVGRNWGSISNCYNTGTVSGNSNVGGVVGSNVQNSIISNCYNTGTVSGTAIGENDIPYNYVGGVVGSAQWITNCYYLENSALVGIGGTESDSPGSTVKMGEAFASGEVAWLLQNGQADSAVQVWGQKLVGTSETPADTIPLLKTADPICKITYLQGDGETTYKVGYANQNQTTTPEKLAAGYVWKDSNQGTFTSTTLVGNDLSVHCCIATLPTATANLGTKLSAIPFTGGSVDSTKWSWSESVDNLNLVLAFGNTTAYKATYTSDYPAFGTVQIEIIPTITKSLTDAGVSVSLAADSYTATGAAITPTVTVTDAGITIATDDYSVAYTNNISPGTATVTITGKGNYAGIVTKNFTITSSGGGGGGYTPPSPPAMPGVVVNPGTITFDPAGHLAVDITGAPAGSVVYYSLDGITFTTTPPAMENAGEHTVYIKVTSPGYQDYITQTTVTVEKHEAPVIPEVSVPVPLGQQTGSTDLGALLPPNRGQIRYQLVSVNDPREILSGTPTIDPNGRINYGFARPRSASGENLTASAATDSATSSATITVLVTMENYADTTIILVVSAEEAFGVQYQTHIQDIGWETDWKTDGALSGTEGQSKRLEALKVELTGDVPAGATIDTAVHVQNVGNLGPFAMGTAAGTTGESLRLENICLTLKNLPGYTILYDVHVQNQGWLRDENDASTWFKSGEIAGTSALSLRLEGIRIKLVKDE